MKEHDEINVVFFSKKKILKMISSSNTMHCEFVYLVNELIFFIGPIKSNATLFQKF